MTQQPLLNLTDRLRLGMGLQFFFAQTIPPVFDMITRSEIKVI